MTKRHLLLGLVPLGILLAQTFTPTQVRERDVRGLPARLAELEARVAELEASQPTDPTILDAGYGIIITRIVGDDGVEFQRLDINVSEVATKLDVTWNSIPATMDPTDHTLWMVPPHLSQSLIVIRDGLVMRRIPPGSSSGSGDYEVLSNNVIRFVPGVPVTPESSVMVQYRPPTEPQ